MKVLVINCGSSSIKYRLYDMRTESELARGLIERIGEAMSEVKHQAGAAETRLRVRPKTGFHATALRQQMMAFANSTKPR